MPALVVRSQGKEERVPLGTGPLVVGRAQECDITIEEIRASRRHFEVRPTERGWLLTDLESSNGTAVNDFGVSKVLLSHGDIIEVGDVEIEFESEGASAPPRVPRAPRPAASSGGRWAGVVVAVLGVAVLTDHFAVEAAGDRSRSVDAAIQRAAHQEFLLASSVQDPAEAELALQAFLKANPGAADAAAAAATLARIQAGRDVRQAAIDDCRALDLLKPILTREEHLWRVERLLERWIDEPEALAEVRRRLQASSAPTRGPAGKSGDDEVFRRRSAEAAAAVSRGELGRAASLWAAHAEETGTGGTESVRRESSAVEDAASARVRELFRIADDLRRDGKVEEAAASLRQGLPALEGTVAGRRLAARIGRGESPRLPSSGGASGSTGPAASRAGGTTGSPESTAGYEKQRSLYLRAREAEQFVALRDYDEATRRFRVLATESEGLADVHAEMSSRVADLAAVSALLEGLRAVGSGSPAKPLPQSWDALLPEDLYKLLDLRVAKVPSQDLALAAFAWDQGLRDKAVSLVADLLQNDTIRAAAESLYARREGLRIPEGGFVGEKGTVLTRAEWNRRRNAEAITALRAQQAKSLKKFRDSTLVKSIEKMATLRAELDRRRAHALELIFDEVKYFYPYRDRMGEYTPVQQEVDRRVAAVREVWDSKEKVRTKPDGTAAQALKELEESETKLRELGGEPGSVEAELAVLRRYLDRELTVRTFTVNPEEDLARELDEAVLKENATRKTEASEPEREQVRITNEYRIMFNRRALRIHDTIVKAARAHGNDMSRGGFFSHHNEVLRDPTKTVPVQACGCSSAALQAGCSHGPDARLTHAGYQYFGCSENIHMGSGDPLGAHNGWVHSSGHHRNILTKGWTEMGTGQVGRHWIQKFGIPVPTDDGTGADAGGGARWDRAGGRGTGGDGNDPEDER